MLPVWQTWPIDELPFEIPFTNHETLTSEVFETAAAKVARWFVATVADGGEMEMPTPLTMVTLAETLAALPADGLMLA